MPEISLFSSVIFTSSLSVALPSFLQLSIISVASFNSSRVPIISIIYLLEISADSAALCVSCAWLVAPSAILVTAVATSLAMSDVDCAVAVSSSAVAAVFCACELISAIIPTRFLLSSPIALIAIPTSSLVLLYPFLVEIATSSVKSRL